MIGVSTPARRTCRQTSKPSCFGSITSSRIKSNSFDSARRAAVTPSDATSVSYPSRRRSSSSARAILGSSSTTRMRFMPGFSYLIYGQQDGESRATRRLAVKLQTSAMRPHNLLGHRQPDSRAFHVHRVCRRAAHEFAEHLASFVFGDTSALILDRDAGKGTVWLDRDANR